MLNIATVRTILQNEVQLTQNRFSGNYFVNGFADLDCFSLSAYPQSVPSGMDLAGPCHWFGEVHL